MVSRHLTNKVNPGTRSKSRRPGAVPACFLALMLCLGGLPAMAWEGFEWDAWKTLSGCAKPEISSPQAGLPALLPLLPEEATLETWQAREAQVREALETLIGKPSGRVRPAPVAELLGEENLGTYTRRHIRIPTEADDWIPAYVLIPKELPESPMPAMIVLHQTQSPGKQEAVGMVGDPQMAFAPELVARGYICIAPDVIGFGERIPEGTDPYHDSNAFYVKHPKWSYFGKMIWDFQQVVNYLESLPEVDPQRIGSIGHSHGAYGTIMCSLFEPRIAAAAASCGFTTLRSDPRPDRWSHLTALLPSLGFYVDDIATAPFDWHEVIGCLAPRPYLNWATQNDDIFPNTANFFSVYQQVSDVYALYEQRGNFVGYLAPGKHQFPPTARAMVYEWLDAHLKQAEGE